MIKQCLHGVCRQQPILRNIPLVVQITDYIKEHYSGSITCMMEPLSIQRQIY